MALSLSASAESFLAEAHPATLSTMRPDGSPHTVPVLFTWDSDNGDH
jgi:F420H(2)-dependent biliverdin reductase